MHELESVLAGLRRFPDTEAPNLFAVDPTDRLLLDSVPSALQVGAGMQIAVVGDRYGALTLGAAVQFGATDIRVHQDSSTSEAALARNAAALGLSEVYGNFSLGEDLLQTADVVLMQLPRSVAELTEVIEVIAAYAPKDVLVLAGGRDKHMFPAMNNILRKNFEDFSAGRGRQKSRVLSAAAPIRPASRTYPVTQTLEDIGLTVVAHGAVFAGSTLDIGTRFLLEHERKMKRDAQVVVDLGCGTGIVACMLAHEREGVRVLATDRSTAAVDSARATAEANGLAVEVLRDDAMATLEDDSVDLIVCNPPFHEGAAVHTGGAEKLFAAAGRVLRPGGELWTVYNWHLNYRAALAKAVGPTEVKGKNKKFTVTRSTVA
ncbi:class I SAM-dependent methyltransferase [Rhodococcus sp. 1168]|uniref:class I SAM-dependent methyltransferase n=1 Tax=Rhodococcus sp. 1168 TaxID=2018041 RepID=UPI000A0CD2A3|nr:class I SAM-dependent methyltransferase [Rhodococcus sp. 1168]ORI16519.1 SAM-dependent methyltransferase [Rhodococcus sp. 1168]